MQSKIGLSIVVAFVLAGAGLGAYLVLDSPKPEVRKVVLLSIDALRADRLGCYGYPRGTSPHLDALAEESLLFEKAFSQAPWTGPSMSTIFTGRYPIETGMYRNRDRIDAQVPMLAEIFQKRGFRTASLNTHSLLLSPFTGFLRGFDYTSERQPLKVPYTQIEPDVMRWLDENAESSFFLWIHNMDPHTPATVGNTYRQGSQFRGYDAEVKWVDDSVGRLVEKLKSLKIWEETLFIFTADHGEAFGDHKNVGHQNVMYDEVLRVPLLIRYPGMKRLGRTDETVELLDLFATMGDLAGLEVPVSRSESLVPIAEGKAEQRRKMYAFSSRYYFENGQHELAVRDRAWKLIVKVQGIRSEPGGPLARPPQWNLEAPTSKFELYKTAQDPGEKYDLIGNAAPSDVVERLREALVAWQKLVTPGGGEGHQPATEPDAATLEILRALGYED